MKNKQSGQALIEFVMILPVLIMLIFSFVDLGRIILENNRLESLTTIVINKYSETQDYSQLKDYIVDLGYDDVDLSLVQKNNTLTVGVTKKVSLVTPGLDKIIGDPYHVKIERVVNYER